MTIEIENRHEEFVAAVAQFASVDDAQANIDTIRTLARQAQAQGARMVVFPEAASFAFESSAETLSRIARDEAAGFRAALSEIARDLDIHIVAGMYAEGEGELSRNCLVAVDPQGETLGEYQKLHLYDAFLYRESDKNEQARLQQGFGELVLFDIGAFRFGLVNCYDLRFPEMARALVERGANCLIVCAGWVAGPLKELHWETLLRARAIENTSYVLASSQPAPVSTGLSMAIDPSGVVLSSVAADKGVALATLTTERLQDIRAILPCLEHARYRIAQREDNGVLPEPV